MYTREKVQNTQVRVYIDTVFRRLTPKTTREYYNIINTLKINARPI